LFSSTLLLRRLIEEEWFGPLRGLRISEGGQTTKTGVDHTHYEDVRMAGGGLLMSVGCHGLDLALHVTRTTSFDVLDAELEMDGEIDRKATAKINLISGRFESRRECLLDFCVSNLDMQDNVVEFDFPKVVVSASNGPQGGVSVRSKETNSSGIISDSKIFGAVTLNQAFYLEWKSFLRGLAGGYPSLISAASSSLTAALIDDLYSWKDSSVVGHRA
jgi:predicted dehydrogenase